MQGQTVYTRRKTYLRILNVFFLEGIVYVRSTQDAALLHNDAVKGCQRLSKVFTCSESLPYEAFPVVFPMRLQVVEKDAMWHFGWHVVLQITSSAKLAFSVSSCLPPRQETCCCTPLAGRRRSCRAICTTRRGSSISRRGRSKCPCSPRS